MVVLLGCVRKGLKPQPGENCGYLNEAEKLFREFFKPTRDSSIFFNSLEEIFDIISVTIVSLII